MDSVNEQAQGVRIVRWLAENGVMVVAAGAGASHWPLCMQCQVLLAGAVALLDSALPEFGSELSRRLSALLSAGEARRSEDEQLRRLMRAHGLIARGDVMLDAFRRVLRIARLSNLPVLISGESGTGKELVARAIHARDPARADHPFVAVNCAAIPPAMAESELFGHRRGAFTGADRDRKGLMRSANTGVLFLDEIGDLGVDVQAKLLRVLQEGRVLGVGEDVDVPVNLRIVAATNRDLSQMVADKRFRLDLYHRLNVLPLRLPPLRERQEDIEPLVTHLVAKHGGHNTCGEGASAEFLGALSRLTLPGNVRQLENLVTQALVNRDGDGPLSLIDLPRDALAELAGLDPTGPYASTQAEDGQQDTARNVHKVVRETGWDLSKSLRVYEKMIVEAALTQTAKNQSRAARLLGVTPRTIYNLVRRHHLNF
jgi:transcriptional regulator with GAF, ATPase, and Fis domain